MEDLKASPSTSIVSFAFFCLDELLHVTADALTDRSEFLSFKCNSVFLEKVLIHLNVCFVFNGDSFHVRQSVSSTHFGCRQLK